jgi:hypothetical protein
VLHAAAAREHPPWLGDASVYAAADRLDPLVIRAADRYELTAAGRAVLTGDAHPPATRPLDRRRPPRARPSELGLGRRSPRSDPLD